MKVVTPLAVAALAVSLGIVPAARAAGDGKVATVGEHAITRAQLEEHVRAKLIELENQRYEMLREGLDELIAEELVKQEASARKTPPAVRSAAAAPRRRSPSSSSRTTSARSAGGPRAPSMR